MAAAVEKARRDGSATVEYAVHCRDETVRTLETHIENLLDDPVIRGFVFIARDVTETRQARAELERRSEVDRFVAALSRSLVAATPATLDSRVTESLEALVTRFAARAGALFLRAAAEPRFSTAGAALSLAHLDLPESGPFVAFDPAGAERAGWVLAGPDGPRGTVVLEWPPESDVSRDELEPLEVIVAALVVAVERLDAEHAVRASEVRFRTLAAHATDLVVVVGPDLQLRYLSDNAAAFLGMTDSDAFDPSDSVVHPDDREAVTSTMQEVMTGGNGSASHEFVARFRRRDGVYRSMEIVVTNLLDVADIGGIVINGHDVTDRLEIEDALRQSERRFRGLVQNLAESVTVLAGDGSVKYSSASAARMMGFDQGHGAGKFGLDFVVEEDRDRVAETVARAFSEPGIQGPVTLRVRAAGDQIRVIEALGHNRLDDPDVEGIVVTARDITERVEAEEAARRSDSRLRALVENLSDVITVVEPDGSIVYTSPTAHRLFGFDDDDVSRVDPTARIHPDDHERATREMAQRIAQGDRHPVRFRLRAADGTWRSVETIMSDMTSDPAVGAFVVTTRDVSDRTRAEALVADQAEVLKLIARGAPLTETVLAICGVLERHVDEAAFGMLLMDAVDERLHLVASPQVPHEFADCCGELSVAEAEALFGGPLDEIGDLLDLRNNPMPVLLHAVTDSGIGGLRPTPIFDTGTGRVIGVIVAFVAEPEPAPRGGRRGRRDVRPDRRDRDRATGRRGSPRSPGEPRPVDRPAQPGPVPGVPVTRARPHAARREHPRRAVSRPRPLQAHQRRSRA